MQQNQQRQRLVDEIQMEAKLTEKYTGRSAFSPKVIKTIANTPREFFVAPNLLDVAYMNAPLSIGHGQTISQPYIVALMTDLLDLDSSHRVLEIGTGCGYQTAILSQLADRIFTVEIIEELALKAKETFQNLDYSNIDMRIGDGSLGWQEQSPFDRIIVTAATSTIPPALIEQLKPGGLLVIPIGQSHSRQELTLIHKTAENTVTEQAILPVVFVPLTHP